MRRRFKQKILFTVFAGIITAGGCHIYAQTPQTQLAPQFSIFDSFEKKSKPGEGAVVVHQSEAIKRMVGTRIDSENIDIVNGKTYLITKGYRVHVYSGNNQRASREEALLLQGQLKKSHPELETYVTFNAPFWKLHIGNFRSFEEASVLLRDLREVFPKKKNELYIIEDDIRLPLDDHQEK